jgi:hypothetical protein
MKVSVITPKPFCVVYTKEKGREELSFQQARFIYDPSSFLLTLHREDGPAVEHHNEAKEWFLNGLRHREDGPAIVWEDGQEEWFLHNKRHRLDGPALINNDLLIRDWYLDNEPLIEHEHIATMNEVNKMTLAERLTDPRWWVREYKQIY